MTVEQSYDSVYGLGKETQGVLLLSDGSSYKGTSFGAPVSVAGETVFQTGKNETIEMDGKNETIEMDGFWKAIAMFSSGSSQVAIGTFKMATGWIKLLSILANI